ncbi:Uncharacterised protein [Bordetella pertussis]|nr:Uncharacterised protein [Bordetella pertussis]
MPHPMSETQTSTNSPASAQGLVCTAAASSSRWATSISRSPPAGMASQALITRFSTAFSNWFMSQRTRHDCAGSFSVRRTCSPV